MLSFVSTILALLLHTTALVSVSAVPITSCVVNGHTYHIDEVITKDFLIVGGGSSGTYSAIRLKDSGKSIVVVEATDRLGGHTQTYIDPATGIPIDYGVQVWHNLPEVVNYFARLNVSIVTGSLAGPPTTYLDFKTGKEYPSFIPGGSPTAFSDALAAYSGQVFQYPYLDYGFSLPNPIPPDLLLPFHEFVEKYSLGALVPFLWTFTQGVGDILNVPTIYIMKAFGIADIESLASGFIFTEAHDNSLLYAAAETVLSNDVLYSSTVLAIERDTSSSVPISAIISTRGKTIWIQATKLIIAIQPTLDNLSPLNLDDHEKDLFAKFKWTTYFTTLLNSTGLPPFNPATSPSSIFSLTSFSPSPKTYNIPHPPLIYILQATPVSGIWSCYFIGSSSLSISSIKDMIVDAVSKIDVPGKVDSKPEFVVESNHAPFQLAVSSEDIENGFYRDLYALQGEKGTWFVSATMHAHDSSLIWRFVEGLMPELLA